MNNYSITHCEITTTTCVKASTFENDSWPRAHSAVCLPLLFIAGLMA